MRTSEERLRKCPTCGGETEGIGLRDYGTWLSEGLPSKVGATDLDFVLEQSRTDRVLIIEFKPKGAWVPTGQKITLKRFVKAGMDVWVVWEKDDDVEVGVMDRQGGILVVEKTNKAGLRSKVETWWKEGYED